MTLLFGIFRPKAGAISRDPYVPGRPAVPGGFSVDRELFCGIEAGVAYLPTMH